MTAREPRRTLDVRAARLVAADLLSRRAWTRRELGTRLRRRGAPPDVAAAVVEDLTARGYLDDAAFARQWVATRAGRGYGVVRLRAELVARGVAAATIAAALADVAPDASLAAARRVAARRLPALLRAGRERAAPRLRDYLLRRGYSRGVVFRIVRDVVGRAPDEAPDS